MYKVNRAESIEVGEIFHDETVSFALGTYPGVWFEAYVAVDAVEKSPGMCHVTGIHVFACYVAWSAEYWPRDACLEL
jgi:hypothetical protein